MTSPARRDLKDSTLPNFSQVRVDYSYYDEEPPEDIEEGDTWLGQIVQAIAQSLDWSSTALFITYDEGGGFWDHVAPPVKTDYGYGTRIPTVIVSPYTATGIFSQQTTNTSIPAFMEKLWHLKPLNAFTAEQNDFMGAFHFHRRPLAAPALPQAPADTIAFHDSTTSPGPGGTFTVNLQANTPDLTIDSGVSGAVSIKVIPPSGAVVPASFPTTATMSQGAVSFAASLPSAGYWRLEATGPGSSEGFTTVDVGVTPNTP